MLELGRLLLLDSKHYGRILYQITEVGLPCSRDNLNDGVMCTVLADNNCGLDNADHYYHMPNERVGTQVKGCSTKMEKELRTVNGFKLIPKSQESTYRKLLQIDQAD